MDTWAKATPKDREALFNQTASIKGIAPEIVEKDFWVCWILYWIFHLQGLPRLIFKGGTSLSKVFGIISRFSEDVDLVINRHQLGFNDESDPANQQGTKLRDRTIEKLKSSYRDVIAEDFVPGLQAAKAAGLLKSIPMLRMVIPSISSIRKASPTPLPKDILCGQCALNLGVAVTKCRARKRR
jgi:hypothetical protein